MRARLFLLILPLLLASCGRRPTDGATEGDTLRLRHASLLTVVRTDSFTQVDVADPWHEGHTLRRYLLVGAGRPLPHGLPEGTVVRTPLRRAVAFSTVHASLMAELHALDGLAAVCDSRYVVSPALRRALDSGRLADGGSSMTPDAERLLALRPDALLVSPYEGGGHGVLEQAGVPLIECADYMEASALGRAEWMRFYGLLFGCEARADSLFALVERRYESLRRQAPRGEARPTLLVDRMDGGTWYVPAARSTMGQIYTDAGAHYAFADQAGRGSVPLAFETVLARAGEADLWLVKYGQRADLTYSQLAADYPPYARFRAFRARRVYGCNTMRVPFYDETPFRPDLLLADLVGLFRHPDRREGRYFTPLHE